MQIPYRKKYALITRSSAAPQKVFWIKSRRLLSESKVKQMKSRKVQLFTNSGAKIDVLLLKVILVSNIFSSQVT